VQKQRVTTVFIRTKAWNTKRQYRPEGQRIAAGLLEDGTVMFADVDRGIFGKIDKKFPPAPVQSEEYFQWFVMYHYDRNNYCSDCTDMKELMNEAHNL
jgi:hypothetical protein